MANGFGGFGTFLSGYGQFQSSDAEARALNREANIAEENARRAKEISKLESEQVFIQAKKLLGEQQADFAAGGVSGASTFAVMADSMINAELDRLTVLFGGDVRSANFMAEASSKRRARDDIRDAGAMNFFAGAFSAGS